MSKISTHVSFKEATRSSTAKRYGIDNSPSEFQLANMRLVAENCFEPLREHHGKAIFVSSFMRSKELNEHRLIRGSKTSQHMQGIYTGKEEGAMDIDCDVFDNGLTNREAFHWLRVNVDYDQLIYEYPDGAGDPGWVHVSYRKGANRGQTLIAYRNSEGKRKYVPYSDEELKRICGEML